VQLAIADLNAQLRGLALTWACVCPKGKGRP
jgi:hypothetical protein